MAVTSLARPVPARPPVLPGEWQFWADTIIGNQPLGQLHPHGFSATMRLSGFGTGQVTLPAADSGLDQARLLRLWSWRLWAFYAGRPIWCGAPTGIADEGGTHVTLTLTEITGYLTKRQYDVPGGHVYSQAEQTLIAADLAAPVADAGVTVLAQPGPGFPRDRAYEYLEGESRAALLENLSQVISGPEFRTEYDMTPAGLPAATLRIAYPRVGAATGLVLAAPGQARGYRAAWDADMLRTRTFAVGDVPESAPEGTPKPVAVTDLPQPDLPRLDAADDWPGTILASTLHERAAAGAAAYAAPVLDLSATAGLTLPPPDAYAVGDDVTVRLVTPFLPGGLDVPARLTEVTLSAGEGTAAWTVAVGVPPPQPRPSLTRRLDRIDARLRGMFQRRLTPI